MSVVNILILAYVLADTRPQETAPRGIGRERRPEAISRRGPVDQGRTVGRPAVALDYPAWHAHIAGCRRWASGGDTETA